MVNLGTLLNILLVFSGVIALGSGLWLLVRGFFLFRARINRSLNMDVEIVRVSKITKPQDREDRKPAEAWKEEIGPMEQLFTAISLIKEKSNIWQRLMYDTPSVSLEIAKSSESEEIIFYFAFPRKFKQIVEKHIHSYFSGALLESAGDYNIFFPGSYTESAVLTLKESHFLPIKTYESMESDPLNAISNSLSKLETVSEGAAIQLVFKSAGTAWRSKGRTVAQKMQQGKRLHDVHSHSNFSKASKVAGHFVFDAISSRGKAEDGLASRQETFQLTPEEQELIKGIENKSNKSGLKVNIRLVASAGSPARAQEILSHLENAFSQYQNSDFNFFKVKKRMKKKDVIYDFIFRNFKEEDAVTLSVEEAASIIHLPISVTETPRIKLLKSNTAPPPTGIPEEGLLMGFNEFRGVETKIRMSDDDRRRHVYVIGQTGTGKSTLIQELAKQDAINGKGFCFIDPHGEAIEDILTCIPKERAEDVVIFNPADIERPIGLNMLEYDQSHPEQKTFVINEMIGIFDQLYDLKATGGPMFEQYMRNAMLLIMDDPESGSTLMEISKVLSDEEFRRMKISKCKNPPVVDFWVKEAEKAGGEAALANMVPYITSKLTSFISNDIMRPIIAQQESSLKFREIMDNGKILLVNLSKGKIGEINANLLGMVIVGKILMAALSRVDTPQEERRDFHLYLDEFQNVTTTSIAQILSEARKYRLCLTIAHQFIGQLKEEISKAVFGNVGSMFCFRVGSEDGEFMQKQFEPVFLANDLTNVDNRNCFAKILINNHLTKPFNMKPYPPTKGSQEIANALKELSRLKYGRDKDIVNEEIFSRTQLRSLDEL